MNHNKPTAAFPPSTFLEFCGDFKCLKAIQEAFNAGKAQGCAETDSEHIKILEQRVKDRDEEIERLHYQLGPSELFDASVECFLRGEGYLPPKNHVTLGPTVTGRLTSREPNLRQTIDAAKTDWEQSRPDWTRAPKPTVLREKLGECKLDVADLVALNAIPLELSVAQAIDRYTAAWKAQGRWWYMEVPPAEKKKTEMELGRSYLDRKGTLRKYIQANCSMKAGTNVRIDKDNHAVQYFSRVCYAYLERALLKGERGWAVIPRKTIDLPHPSARVEVDEVEHDDSCRCAECKYGA